jgi:Fic family protein
LNRKLLDVLCEEKAMRLKGGLYHQTQIQLAYNSNRIEGSKLTEEQTRHIFETNSFQALPQETTNVNDIIETINHFSCFDYMLDAAKKTLSEDFIKETHRLLKRNTSQERIEWFKVGDYKTRPNIVGDTKTTAPGKVEATMKKLIDSYADKDKIGINEIVDFHYQFEKIHPFQDGNGRVGRIILFKECLKNNIMPFIIRNEHKLFYYRGLKEFGTEKGFLTDTCLSAQDAYEKTVKYFFPIEST